MNGWEAGVRKVVPYTPGEQPKNKNIIKLNTNENPYGPSNEALKALEGMDMDEARRYPDPTASELVKALADYYSVDENQVFVGVGSDDVLGMCFMTFFNQTNERGERLPILFPDITYSFYPVWADMLGIPYETKALKDDFTIDAADYNGPNGGIVIPNPNAPTAIYMAKAFVEDIVKNNPSSIVIIDEAYIDFAPQGSSVIDLIDKYDNLIVVRTYSKSRSMAGLRIGYAISNPKIIKFINDVKYSYNSYTMNAPSIKLGAAVVKDEEYFRETISKIVKTREEFAEKIKGLGFTVLPSSANFVFASPPEGYTAEELFEECKKRGIYVRYFKQPRINNFLRITIGKEQDMRTVYEFFKDFLTR
ncbi:MAG: histidinol-phosphate transaminase [Eubacterium sp.]|nr:histidinol-phosphate transaminase [Eubacterium sp.]